MKVINLGKVVGEDGKSAYQTWLDQGNTGTEQDFLDSLKGKDADNIDLTNYVTKDEVHAHSNKEILDSITQENINNWNNGTGGEDGKSAYEIWLEQGNTGTEQDFLDSLKGKDGKDGDGASLSDAQIEEAVSNYLNEHPEATTTVADGSITNGKFADDVNERFGNMSNVIVETIIEPSTLTKGYRMGGQKGTTAAAQQTSAVTDYITIPFDTKRVEFCNNVFELHNPNVYCATYDKDKNFIRNIPAVQIFNTLENERYVRFTCYDSNSAFEDNRIVKFYTNSYYNDIVKSKEICSNMSSVLGGSFKIIPELTDGFRVSSANGWLGATTNVYKCSNIIEIPLGASKIIHTFKGVPNNTTYVAYAVYDKDLNLIVSGSEDTIEIADNYAYIRLCNYDTTEAHENLYCEFVFGNTKEVIDGVVEQTESLSEAVNTSMYKTEDKILYRIPYEMEKYGFYKVNTSKNTLIFDNATSWRNAKIPVVVGDKLNYCVIPYGAYYVVAVDENDTPLDYIQGSENVDVEGSYTVTDTKAKYVYISTRINCTNFYIEKEKETVSKLPSNYEIEAINKKIASLETLLKSNGMTLDLLPDDYMIELARVEDETKAVKGDNTITFAVMADAHYNTSSGTPQAEMIRLADVIKELQNNGVIDFTVSVGDSIENGNTPLTDFTKVLTDRNITYALVRGNHDLVNPSIVRDNATNIEGAVFDTLGDWFYLDNEEKGIRYIFLNGSDKGTDVDNDKNTIQMTFTGVSYRQLNWLANTALKTDKKVIIFNHYSVTSEALYAYGTVGGTVDKNYNSMGEIIKAFVNGASGTIAYTIEYEENGASDSIAYDFSSQGNGTVIANFCGHAHGDRYNQNEGEIMEVWTDNALAYDTINGYKFSNGAVIPNTVDEIAFDVVTIDIETQNIYCKRFGRGKDKTILRS